MLLGRVLGRLQGGLRVAVSAELRPPMTMTTTSSLSSSAGPSVRRSYYTVLGLGQDAGAKDIKDAFIQLSKELHPDTNPESEGAAERYLEVKEAYEVLSDPAKKANYDLALKDLDGRLRRHHHRHRHRGGFTAKSGSPGADAGPQPAYGVDPEFGRVVDVDLSKERMERTWLAYRKRWDAEEDQRRILEEKKLAFRVMVDRKRAMLDHLTLEEREEFKENLRQLRHPDFFRKTDDGQSFVDLSGSKGRGRGRSPGAQGTPPPSFEANEYLKATMQPNKHVSEARRFYEQFAEKGPEKDPEKGPLENWPKVEKEGQKRDEVYRDPLDFAGLRSSRQALRDMVAETSAYQKKFKVEWDRTEFLKEGGQHSVKHGIRPTAEFRVSPWGVSLIFLIAACLVGGNHYLAVREDEELQKRLSDVKGSADKTA